MLRLLSLILITVGCTHTAPRFATVDEATHHLKNERECTGCNLYQAELAYSDLKDVRLDQANLKGADLTQSDLRGADLRGATLIRADLSHGTQLDGCDLRGANLREANIPESVLKMARTCGAILPSGEQAAPCLEGHSK